MGLAALKLGLTPRQHVAAAKLPSHRRVTLKERMAAGEVEWSPCLQRVLALSRRGTPDLGPIIQGLTQVLKAPGGTQTLRDVQAWLMFEAPQAGGAVAIIETGGGKSLPLMLLPMVWPYVKENDVLRPPRAVLFIPPDMRVQFAADWERYSKHWVMPNLAGGSNFTPGRPTLHVIAYSELQQPKNSALLEQLKPDIVMADECSSLKNFEAARVMRVRRHFGAHPYTAFVGCDATPMSESLLDFWHFFVWGLGENSPMPVEEIEVKRWGRAIDPQRDEDGIWLPGQLQRLCNTGEDVRSGFRRRLNDTLGVIMSESRSLGIPLVFRERQAPPMPEKILEYLKVLRRAPTAGGWRRPDNEELQEAAQVVACARQLAAGLYLRWRFPKGESRELIDEWFDKRQSWNRELRAQLQTPQVHLDSRKLCENAAARWYDGGCPSCARGPLQEHAEDCREVETHPLWISWCYPAWREIRDKVYHETEAVWESDFLIDDMARWAKEAPGIVWVDHPDIGQRLAQRTGLRYFGGGDEAAELLEQQYGEANGPSNHSIICSVKATSRGKNLQYAFSRNLITLFPASNSIVDQLVGRTYRSGQTSKQVTVDYYLHTKELENAFDLAKARAEGVWQALGTAQKLVYGDFQRAA